MTGTQLRLPTQRRPNVKSSQNFRITQCDYSNAAHVGLHIAWRILPLCSCQYLITSTMFLLVLHVQPAYLEPETPYPSNIRYPWHSDMRARKSYDHHDSWLFLAHQSKAEVIMENQAPKTSL
jgi:hypothetical protein